MSKGYQKGHKDYVSPEARMRAALTYSKRYKGRPTGKKQSPETRAKRGIYRTGKDNPRWTGAWTPEKKKEYMRAYRTLNKDIINAISQHRRAKIKRAGGRFTVAEWQEVKAKNQYYCVICRTHESESRLTIDHIIPLSRGGNNNIENIQPLCKSCNSRKQDKMHFCELCLAKI